MNANTGDTDGLLVNTLLEALTGTNRLNVGAYGRSTRTPTNYSAATQSIDDHLAGIDTALGTGSAHDFEGSSHNACTLAEFNAADRISDSDLIASADSRILVQGENDACVGTSGTPSSTNKFVTNADTRNTNARTPSGTASGDLSSSYPGPGVAKIQGYAVQGGAPTTKDILQWSGSAWNHVTGVAPNYDSGWFAVNYSTLNYVSKTHGLGVLPRQIQLFVSANSNGNPGYVADYWMWSATGTARGCTVRDITTTTLRVAVGNDGSAGVLDTLGSGGTRVVLSAGWARVMCWK